jgi:hypothetical protein
MEQSTTILSAEQNEQHERALGSAISNEQLMCAAENLSAIMAFGDKEGVALTRPAGSDRCIPLQDLGLPDLDAAQVAARRRLFSSPKPEQVQPEHKTIGDYLAAKALVRRIQNRSLPLGRALSLVRGNDGAPPSHLRDVHGWLVALLPDHAQQLIKTDLFGSLVYGDVAQWPVATCRTALELLSAYAATRDPWFRAETWYAPLLGGLARRELVDDFREILKTEPSPHVQSVVLSAIEYGRPLPEIGDDLLAFIRDHDLPNRDWLKDDALRAFVRVCPERIGERKTLLEDIRSGVVGDEDHMLRAELLMELYPSEVEPHEIVRYFAHSGISGLRTMGWFVRRHLVDNTPVDALPVLAASILDNPDDVRKLGEFERKRLNGALIRRLLETHGDAAAPDRIYEWLGVYIDEHAMSPLKKEDREAIGAYLQSRPELYTGMFRHWLDQTEPCEDLGYWYYLSKDFQSRILDTAPPADFPETLLTWAATETDPSKAAFLFEEAARLVMRENPGAYAVDVESLSRYVDEHPSFAEIWDRQRVREISDWRWKQARRAQEERKERETRRARNIRILMPRIEKLRTGRDLQNLDFGAQTWFGLTYEAREEDAPANRIQQQSNGEIAQAMHGGFEALLKTASPKSPSEIAKLNCKTKRFWETYAVLAGAEILSARSMQDFLGLPSANLRTALAYHLMHAVGNDTGAWAMKIMAARPVVARETLREIWRAQLAAGCTERLTGTFIARSEDDATPIILSEIYSLLHETPALPPRILEDLLKAVLRHGDAEELQPLFPLALADRRVRGAARVLWLAVAALFAPADHADRLDRKMRSGVRGVSAAHAILTADANSLLDHRNAQGARRLQLSISLLGKVFNNVPFIAGGRTLRVRGDRDAAQSIRGLIDTLAGLPMEDAAKVFETLIGDPALHEWHDYLRHAQAVQAKNLRDARFERPSAQAVSLLLAGGPPASMADFHALATDVLNDIAAAIPGDNANLWKSFWTHAGRGKLDKPKIENDSRDEIVKLFRPYLDSKKIMIEPEGSAADQKRVDIRLMRAGLGTLPIEIKRDDNADLWTAMRDQLSKRYANDPKTGGYGIYLVVWYGKQGNGCTHPPEDLDIAPPITARDLREALEAIKPDARFAVRVVDVSKPHD